MYVYILTYLSHFRTAKIYRNLRSKLYRKNLRSRFLYRICVANISTCVASIIHHSPPNFIVSSFSPTILVCMYTYLHTFSFSHSENISNFPTGNISSAKHISVVRGQKTFHVPKERFMERSSASFFMHRRCASLRLCRQPSGASRPFTFCNAKYIECEAHLLSPVSCPLI